MKISLQFKKAAAHAGILCAVVVILCLIKGAQPALLGQSIDGLNTTTIRQYPWVTALESLKVLSYFYLVIFLTFLAAQYLKQKRNHQYGIQSYASLLSYALPFVLLMLVFGWQIISYPAIFEGNLLPTATLRTVHRIGHFLAPLSAYGDYLMAAMATLVCYLAFFPNSYIRKPLPGLALSGTLVFVGWSVSGITLTAHTANQSNIYLIVIDSLRFDRMGNQLVTPNLSALRAEPNVVNFKNHFIGLPRTFPSWTEMLSGKYAPQTGVRHMFPGFMHREDAANTLISDAATAGFYTEVISDFAGDVFPRYPFGFKETSTPTVTMPFMIRMNVDQFFPLILPLLTLPASEAFFPALRGNPAFADPQRLTLAASKRLLATTSAKNLLTVFFSTAHFPYAAPHPFYTRFTSENYDGSYFFQKNPILLKGNSNLSDADIEQIRNLYDASLASIDDALGKFFDFLKAHQMWDSATIIVTADHGEDLLEPGRLHGHGEHLRGENVLKVPLLIKTPKSFDLKTHEIDFITRSVDLRPTIAAISGIPRANEISGNSEGIDLSLCLKDASRPAPDLVAYHETGLWFSQKDGGFFQNQRLAYPGIAGLLKYDVGYSGEINLDQQYEDMVITAKHRGITTQNHRLIYTPTQDGIKWELYDRRIDPASTHNLADEQPETLAQLKQMFKYLVGRLESERTFTDEFFLRHD